MAHSVDTSQLERVIQGFKSAPGAIHKAAVKILKARMPGAVRRVQHKLSGEVLHPRTGHFRKAISWALAEDATSVTGRLGVLQGSKELPYPAAHEFGAEIKPVNAKVLTIPLKAALTPSGVPRFTAREAGEKYLTFWHKTQSGSLILFGYKGSGKNVKDKQLIPLFVGVTHATIPARRPSGSTVDEYQPIIMHDLEQQLAGELLPELT